MFLTLVSLTKWTEIDWSTKIRYQSFLTDCGAMQQPPDLRREDVEVQLLKLFLDSRFLILIGLSYSGGANFSNCW